MKKNLLGKLVVTTVVGALIIGLSPALVSAFPDKPINVVVPFSPGGGTDTICRVIVSVATPCFGEPLVATIKSGGGGTIGTAYMATSKPSGYTVLFTPQGPVVVRPQIDKLPYTRDDLLPIARMTTRQYVLACRADASWNNLKELWSDVKKNPEKFSYASPGKGELGQIATEYWQVKKDLKLTHVPYQGGGPALGALLGSHVDLITATYTRLRAAINEGSVKVLVVYGPEREKKLPDVPTLMELGVDFGMYDWQGVLGPKGLPPEVYSKLVQGFKEISNDPSYKKIIPKLGDTVNFLGGKEFQKFYDEMYNRISEIIPIVYGK